MTPNDTLLAAGDLLPRFRLPSAGGQTVSLDDLRGRRNLVLCLVGTAEQGTGLPFLEALHGRQADLTAEKARVLVIAVAPEAEARRRFGDKLPTFTVLADEEGTLHRQYGAVLPDGPFRPLVLIADRYTKIYAQYAPAPETPWPTPDDVLEWLAFIGMQCPE